MPVPSLLSLTNIPDGARAVAADERNNFAAIQSALNTIIGYLGSASDGDVLTWDQATTSWKHKAGAPTFNIKDYGALGSPANDQPAIQAALDAAGSITGSHVIVPPNAVGWLINTPLNIPDGVTLRGVGPAGSRIFANDGFVGTAMVKNKLADGTQEFAWVKDLELHARGVAAKCLLFDTIFVNSGIDNVLATNATSHGIHITTSVGAAGPIFLRDVWTKQHGGDLLRVENQMRGVWMQNITAEYPASGQPSVRIISSGGTSQTHYILGLHLENFAIGVTGSGVLLDNVIGALIEVINVAGTAATAYSDIVKLQNACAGIEINRICGYSGLATNVVVDPDNSVTLATAGRGNFLPGYRTPDFGPYPSQVQTLTYSASISTDVERGTTAKITATNGTAFTINAPTNPRTGEELTYDITNSSGGAMGAITWNAVFKLAGAFTNPANTKRRTITFYYDGSSWVEKTRASADI